MQKRIRCGILALFIAATSVGMARADAVLTFTSPTLTVTPGGTVEFDGTLTNTGIDDLYLNSAAIDSLFPDLTVDDSPFFADSPLFLSPGDSYTGHFFDVTADAATLPGSYDGAYTIQGGADSETFDDIATANFTVDVSSPVPEPNPLILIATGLAMIALVGVRRRWQLSK
jgi:hypothetical protein